MLRIVSALAQLLHFSGVISNCPLVFPTSILDTFQPAGLISQCHILPTVHWERPWCWERLKAKGNGRQRMGWFDSIINSMDLNWANSGRQWRTEEPGVLQPMRWQSWAGLSNWTMKAEWRGGSTMQQASCSTHKIGFSLCTHLLMSKWGYENLSILLNLHDFHLVFSPGRTGWLRASNVREHEDSNYSSVAGLLCSVRWGSSGFWLKVSPTQEALSGGGGLMPRPVPPQFSILLFTRRYQVLVCH